MRVIKSIVIFISIVVCLSSIVSCTNSKAKTSDNCFYEIVDGVHVYTKVNTYPVIPGGVEKFLNLVISSFVFSKNDDPISSLKLLILIDKNGVVENVSFESRSGEIKKDNEDRIRQIIKDMGSWSPAKCEGIPVSFRQSIPIKF